MKFEEILPALRNGKKIRRKEWPGEIFISQNRKIMQVATLYVSSLFADDWEIVEETPLPCPFCGENKFDWRTGMIAGYQQNPTSVGCVLCSAYGPYGKDRTEAIELWNRAKR